MQLPSIIRGETLELTDNSFYSCNVNAEAKEHEYALWDFLNWVSHDVKKSLQDSATYIDKHFKNSEYEHNSDDGLIKHLTGTSIRNFSLNTGNVVGFVRKEDYALKIGSRFGDDFLEYMIADTHGFRELKNIGGVNHRDNYDWLLAYLWNIKLRKAYRLGLPKAYVTRNEKTSRVRGTINPVDYFLNKNTGKYLCSYREHSYDNPATSLFIHAYKAINMNYYSFCENTRSIYNELLIANQGVKRTRKEMLGTKYFKNPFYSDYNELIDLSKMVITHQGFNFGNEDESSAFLFDVSMLFEYFICKLIKRKKICLHQKSERIHSILTGGSEKTEHKLEPDIVFEVDGNLYIFDVKYKKFNVEKGVKREDLFQLHTYISQYADNDLSIKGCGFIYPIKGDQAPNIPDNLKIELLDNNIPFYVFFLKIPEAKSLDFFSLMEERCQDFIDNFYGKAISNKL